METLQQTGFAMRALPRTRSRANGKAWIRPTGFTLIEMMVVVVIVGILASATLPLVNLGVHRLKERELRLALREMRSAIDEYRRTVEAGRIPQKVGQSGYPPNLQILVDGVVDTRSAEGRRIYFLRRIPQDPFAPDNAAAAVSGEDRSTNLVWGLRSYNSSADEPKPGEDVYDVYSRSEGIGTNGIAYRNW